MPACSQARQCSEPVGVSVRAFWGLVRSSPAPFLPAKAVVCWARMEKPRGERCSASNRTRRGLLSKAVVKGRTQTEALVQMAHNTDTRHRPPCFQGCLISFLEGWRCRVVAERFLVPVSSRSAKQRDKAGEFLCPEPAAGWRRLQVALSTLCKLSAAVRTAVGCHVGDSRDREPRYIELNASA